MSQMQSPGSRRVSVAGLSTTATIPPGKREVEGLSRFHLAMISVLAASNLFSAVTFSCIVPFFPDEAHLKGMDTTKVGVVIGIFQLATFFVSPIFGKYMVRLRASRAFVGGLLLIAMCTVALGFAHNLPYGASFFFGVLLLRVGQAVGNSATATSSWAIIGRLFPLRIAMLTGVLEVAYGLGFTIGPILGSALYEFGGFALPLCTVGLSFVLIILPSLWIFFRESNGSRESQNSLEDNLEEVPRMLRLLAIPDLFLAVASLFLTCMCWCFYEPSLTEYMATFDVPGWSPSMLAGLMLTLVSCSYLISAPLWGFLTDRFLAHPDHAAPIMLGSSALLALLTLLMGPSPLTGLPKSLFISGFAFALLGLAGAISYVPSFKWCIEAARKKGFSATSPAICGAVSGFMQSSVSLGAFLSTSLGGFSAQHIGFAWTGTLISLLNLIFMAVQIVYRIQQRFSAKSRCAPFSASAPPPPPPPAV